MANVHSSAVEFIEIQRIDADDRLFTVTPEWFPVGPLQQSIERAGVLVPLRVEKLGHSKVRLVSGFRRFAVARNLGLLFLPCVQDSGETAFDRFVTVLWENVGSRPLHEIEKGAALWKLKRVFEVPEAQLVEEFLPLLDIPADRYHLEQYLCIARLPEVLQKAVVNQGLCLEVALEIADWKEVEWGFFVEVTSKYQLGRNKQQELSLVLHELSLIHQSDVISIWQKSGVGSLDEEDKLSPQDHFQKIRYGLKKLRFPKLSQYEENYRALRSSLSLPPQVVLRVPEYFEGNQVSVTFRTRSANELRNLLKKCQELFARPELDRIFELL